MGMNEKATADYTLKVGARAAIATVAGFQEEQGGKKGNGEIFFPVLHSKNE